MKKVEYTAETLPPLTDTQKTALRYLETLPEGEIDTREIPELNEDQLAEARRGRFYRPVKQQITARLDADIVAWLKSKGKGYQTRMNAILRREMLAATETRNPGSSAQRYLRSHRD